MKFAYVGGIIGEDGKIQQVFPKVRAKGHVAKVLEALAGTR